jgi:hypothetical protein
MTDQIAIIELPVRDRGGRRAPGPRAAGQVKLGDDARLELRLASGRVFAIGMDELQRAMIRAALAQVALERADANRED